MWNATETYQVGIFIFCIGLSFLMVEASEFLIIKAINRFTGAKQ